MAKIDVGVHNCTAFSYLHSWVIWLFFCLFNLFIYFVHFKNCLYFGLICLYAFVRGYKVYPKGRIKLNTLTCSITASIALSSSHCAIENVLFLGLLLYSMGTGLMPCSCLAKTDTNAPGHNATRVRKINGSSFQQLAPSASIEYWYLHTAIPSEMRVRSLLA